MHNPLFFMRDSLNPWVIIPRISYIQRKCVMGILRNGIICFLIVEVIVAAKLVMASFLNSLKK